MTQKIKPYGLSLLIHLTFALFLLHITSMELVKTHSVIELDLSLFETQTTLAPHRVSPAVISQELFPSQSSQKDYAQKEKEEAPASITQTTPLDTPLQDTQKKEPVEPPKPQQAQEEVDANKKEQPQTHAENKPQEAPKTQNTSHHTEAKTDKVIQKEQVGYQTGQPGTDTKSTAQRSGEVKQEGSPIQAKREAEQVAVSAEVKRNIYLKEKLSVISSLVQKNITYPPIARRMGWEGRVLLAIHIGEDGSIKDVRVLESSGYEVLDRNAVETVKRVANLFPKPPIDVLVKLPVNYKLE